MLLLVVFTGKVGHCFAIESDRRKTMTAETFVLCTKNIGEIVSWGRFHQHFN